MGLPIMGPFFEHAIEPSNSQILDLADKHKYLAQMLKKSSGFFFFNCGNMEISKTS